jgi:phospholipase C
MGKRAFGKHLRDGAVVTAAILSLFTARAAFAEGAKSHDDKTQTPIKHVIIIIGENRTFDHIFATYQPVHREDTISNLLSKGIVKADGTPGPNYNAARQYSATDTEVYQLAPPKTPYVTLPPALTGGPSTPYGCQLIGITTGTSCDTAANEAKVAPFETAIDAGYIKYLLTGGTGQPSKQPDTRIAYDGQDASHLPPGPFQLTNSAAMPYDAYAASPVHRLFQMWQQLDCSVGKIQVADIAAGHFKGGKPEGCANDLFPWVEVTVGAGSNGKAQPAGFNDESTGEGSTSMSFFNVQKGDAPYLKSLADQYTMSDNYHQAVNGGTGANHIMLGTGDAVWFSDGKGNPATPPDNGVDPDNPGTPLPGHSTALSEIENPNPQPGTNNYYIEDGYGGGSGSPTATSPNANYGGGSYVNCADPAQPGVAAVRDFLRGSKTGANCENGRYYLVNNYNPGYFGDGSNAYTDQNPSNYVYTVPPSSVRTIGDELSSKGISWAYFGDQFDQYLADKYQLKFPPAGDDGYCNICNWAQYSTSIMTDQKAREEHLKDTKDFYADVANGELPAVSYLKPSGLVDGHPASSKLNLFEGFVKKVVDSVHDNNKLWADTAIFVTFDEGGGYYDSGYVQALDFFGDGTRIPMIVVSKYSMGGHISHTYTDHVSTLKFIEANWGLEPITRRSRDNLPNPRMDQDPYVPTNAPAIGDMMDMFNFRH